MTTLRPWEDLPARDRGSGGNYLPPEPFVTGDAAALVRALDEHPVLHELAEQRSAEDQHAAQAVTALRERRAHPQIELRCAQARCRLLTGWNTPSGLLLSMPRVRVSRIGVERFPYPREAHLPHIVETANGGIAWSARAYLWDERTAVFVACAHVYALVPPDDLAAALAEALRTGDTQTDL